MTGWLWFGLVFNSLALLIAVLLFFAGSLEAFPTEQQGDSARLVWGMCTGLFMVTECLFVWLIWRRSR